MRVGGTTRRVTALVTVGAAVAAIAPGAPAATSPVKPSITASAPEAIAPARVVKVTVSLRAKKTKTVRVGLVLATGSRARGGVALGAGRKVRVRAGRRLRVAVSGKLARATFGGRIARLLVCVDPARAVAGRAPSGACAVLKRKVGVAAIGDPVELIDVARVAGRITPAQAALYRLYAVVNSSRLPKVYRGRTVERTHTVLTALANTASALPAATRSQILPYFVPPTASGNAWIGKPRRSARTAAAVTCQGFGQLQSIADGGFSGEFSRRWDAVVSPDNNALVWYLTWTAKPPVTAARAREAAAQTSLGHTSAVKYALAFPTIWNTLTAQFGTPLSDAGEACYHGPDGRYDIYVDVDYRGIQESGPAGAIALTLPYPANGPYPVPGKWCTNRPAFTLIYPGLDNFVLAHEFMHALQFAHRYRTCDEPVAFWDEGGANFAGDMVYPTNQYEQKHADNLLRLPTWFSSPKADDYSHWPFWMMLQRENGFGVLRNVFTQLAGKQAVDAVDAAIPGGFAKQVPRLGLTLWNQTPIGAPGFPVTRAFRQWDGWGGRPRTQTARVALGGLPQRLYNLHVFSGQSDATIDPASVAAYHDITIADRNVKELTFHNALAGKPTHVDAMLHTVGGQWRLEDWTSKRDVVLCRDNAAENVDRIIVVSSNVSKTVTLPQAFHKLTARKTCGYPKRFTGSFHTVFTLSGSGTTETWTLDGTVALVRSPQNPPIDFGMTSYDIVSGTVAWTFLRQGGACPDSSSGTYSLMKRAALVLEDTRLRFPPGGGPKPWLYAIQIGDVHQYDDTCGGVTLHPFLPVPPLAVGGGLVTDTSAVASPSPTLLQGTTHEMRVAPGAGTGAFDESWTFHGFTP